MDTRTKHRIVGVAVACALALPLAADARSFERSVTRTGPHGQSRTWTHHTDVQRSAGRVERQTTHTGPNGRSATTRAVTERTGDGYARSVERTGPDGQTRTRDAVGTPTENGFTRSVVREGPNGTSHSNFTVERDPEAGSVSRSAIHALPDGRTATTQTQVQRTEDGHTRSTTRTGPDGGVLRTDVDVSVDPETGAVTRTVVRTPGAGDSH